MVNQKEIIRKSIKSVLLNVTPLEINEATEKVFNSLINHSSFTLSKTVCIYLAMSKEVQTLPLIRYAFQSNKRVIIPKITGKSPSDMFMLEVESMERILSFPLSNWGIPEPSLDYIATKNDETESGTIDMIYVPGVAFDPKCGRLGHGRAYYDTFIERATQANLNYGNPKPITVGLALDEQIVEEVPMESHDHYLDYVVTPTRIFVREK